jgi:hypothetical protein
MQHPKEKIIKSVHGCFEATKDTLVRNVTSAVKDRKINIDPAALPQLLSLLSASVDDAFHKTYNVFNKELAAALQELSVEQATAKKK